MELLIALFSGAVGGTLAAAVYRALGLGVWLNAAAGVLGGVLGWQAVMTLGTDALARLLGGGDSGVIAAQALAGAMGGAFVVLTCGMARRLLVK